MTVLVTVVVLGGAGTGAWFGLKPLLASFNASDDYPGPGTGSVQVQIPPGATGVDIAAVLQRAGVVKTPKAYLTAARDVPGSANIQPGTYALKLHMTGAGAVQALLDPASRLVKRVTVPEGSRLQAIFDQTASQTSITRAQLDAAAKDTADLGLPAPVKYGKGKVISTAADVLDELAADHEIVRKGVRDVIEGHLGWEVCGVSTRRDIVAPPATDRRALTCPRTPPERDPFWKALTA